MEPFNLPSGTRWRAAHGYVRSGHGHGMVRALNVSAWIPKATPSFDPRSTHIDRGSDQEMRKAASSNTFLVP